MDNLQEEANQAVSAFLLGAGMQPGDYLVMDLQTNLSTTRSCEVYASEGYLIPMGGGDESWNRYTMGSFLAKVDQALVWYHKQVAKQRADNDELRGQIDRLRSKSGGYDTERGVVFDSATDKVGWFRRWLRKKGR